MIGEVFFPLSHLLPTPAVPASFLLPCIACHRRAARRRLRPADPDGGRAGRRSRLLLLRRRRAVVVPSLPSSFWGGGGGNDRDDIWATTRPATRRSGRDTVDDVGQSSLTWDDGATPIVGGEKIGTLRAFCCCGRRPIRRIRQWDGTGWDASGDVRACPILNFCTTL